MEFQPRSGIATVLESVAYFYVRITCLIWYSSTHPSYHMRSLNHPGVAHLLPSTPTYRSVSTIPWFPLHDSLPLSYPPPCFPRLCQGFPNLLFWSLLTPSCASPSTSPPRRPSSLRKIWMVAATLPTVLRLPAASAQFIVIGMLCFYTIFISSVTGGAQAQEWFYKNIIIFNLLMWLPLINVDAIIYRITNFSKENTWYFF